MDIRKLEVFRKVVELKSFTKAAEAALLSQPTVSEHIRSLEEELGLKLVDRLGREAAPTPVGRLLYQYAVRLTQLQQEALQAIARFNGALSGEVRIGASTIPGSYILPRLLATFCRTFPDVKPVLRISDSRAIAAQVLEGTVDLGLVGAIWNERGLEWMPLFADPLVLAVRPEHPLASRSSLPVAELLNHPMVLREQGSGTRKVVARILEQQGHRESDLREAATLGSNEAVREAVKAGIGLAVLSARSIAQDLRSGDLAAVPLDDAAAKRPISLIRRKNRELSPVAAAFLDHLHTAATHEPIATP